MKKQDCWQFARVFASRGFPGAIRAVQTPHVRKWLDIGDQLDMKGIAALTLILERGVRDATLSAEKFPNKDISNISLLVDEVESVNVQPPIHSDQFASLLHCQTNP